MKSEKTSPPGGERPVPESFEEKLRMIQALAEELERGELPLERALAEFEQGMRLIEAARRELDAAEQRVRMITAGGEERDFGASSPAEPDRTSGESP